MSNIHVSVAFKRFCISPHTFSVIAEAHLGLAETNCVFALRDAIELLKFGLVDALRVLLVSRTGRPQNKLVAIIVGIVNRTWLGK